MTIKVNWLSVWARRCDAIQLKLRHISAVYTISLWKCVNLAKSYSMKSRLFVSRSQELSAPHTRRIFSLGAGQKILYTACTVYGYHNTNTNRFYGCAVCEKSQPTHRRAGKASTGQNASDTPGCWRNRFHRVEWCAGKRASHTHTHAHTRPNRVFNWEFRSLALLNRSPYPFEWWPCETDASHWWHVRALSYRHEAVASCPRARNSRVPGRVECIVYL